MGVRETVRVLLLVAVTEGVGKLEGVPEGEDEGLRPEDSVVVIEAVSEAVLLEVGVTEGVPVPLRLLEREMEGVPELEEPAEAV